MDLLSVLGATASLECAILLIALVLFLDVRRFSDLRRGRIMRSLMATLAGSQSQAPEIAGQKAA